MGRWRELGRSAIRRGVRATVGRTVGSATLAALITVSPAATHAAGEVGTPCRAEQQRVCGHAPKGTFKTCLREQADRLSPECRPAEAGSGSRSVGTGRVGSACRAEMEHFCRAVDPGRGRVYRCLREHEAELSLDCRHAIGRP
jgi:hypothetical protein